MAGNLEKYEQLTAYLDGELSDADRREVESLLQRDPEARRLLEKLRRTSRLVSSLPRGAAPHGLSASVLARLERRELFGETTAQEKPPTGPSLRWGRPLAVAAGLAILLTASWLSWTHLRPASKAPTPMVLADKDSTPAKPAELTRQPPVETPERVAFAARRRWNEGEASPQTNAKDHPATLSQTEVTRAAPAARRAVSNEAVPAPQADRLRTVSEPSHEMLPPIEPTAPSQAEVRSEVVRLASRGIAKEEKGAIAPAVAGPSEPGFDDLLAGNVLTNSDIMRAGVGRFANRVELATDAETGKRLAAELSSFLRDAGIPDLRAANLPEPIGPAQPFYFVSSDQSPPSFARERYAKAQASEAAQHGTETHVIVNAPAQQMAHVLAASQRFARMRNAEVSWTANGLRLGTVYASDHATSSEILRRLSLRREMTPGTGDQLLALASQGRITQEASPAAPAKAQEAESPMAAEVRAKASNGISTSDREGPRPGGGTRGAGGAGSAAAGRRAFPAVQDEAAQDFVTLAISIRVSGPTAKPATQEAPGE